jgi:hypothetical protein
MISTVTISIIKGDKYFGVSDQAIEMWAASAENAHEGSVPSRARMDHRRDTNTYLSRYESDYWMDTIRKCSAMPGFICVAKMFHHMNKDTDRVMC